MRARLLLASIVALTGCGQLLGLEEKTYVAPDSAADSEPPTDSAVEDTATDTSPPIDAACVDTTSDPKNCGSCGHVCREGACANSRCQPVELVPLVQGPEQMTFVGDQMYWTEGGLKAVGKVKTCNVASCAPKTLWTDSIISLPFAIAVGSGNVYFTSYFNNMDPMMPRLRRCPIGGCGTPPELEVPTGDYPLGLAIAGTNFYFTTERTGTVSRCPLTGACTPAVVASGQSGAFGLISDADSLYWANSTAGTIAKCEHASGCTSSVRPIVTGQLFARMLTADDENLYWVTNALKGEVSTVMTARKDGSMVREIARNDKAAWSIAVSKTHVYFGSEADKINGTVERCPISGCTTASPPEVLATKQPVVRGMAFHNGALYWAKETAIMRLFVE